MGNRIGGVMVSVLASSGVMVSVLASSAVDRVKPKTINLVFVASPQYKGER
jgi:hypothetical protein